MATAPRPRTTTRDPEDLARRLSAWLDTRLPGAKAAGVTVPESNGMSSETLLFTVEHPEPPLRHCALRLAADPAAYTIFPVYDMPRQYRTMRLVAEHTDVPVPRVLWLEEDPGPLGAPFFVMERVEGRVPPDVMPYTYEGNWLHAATDAERAHLEEASVRVLAHLHDQVPPEAASFLAPPGDGSPLRRHVAAQRAYYAWVVDGLPRSPLIEGAFDRLDELWPRDEGDAVLNWGDARIGNIVYDGFEPAAVLDWEMAAFAPREVDLGWTVYLHRFFQDLTVSFGQRGLPDFQRRDRVEAAYARLTGHTPRDMDFYTLYAALRHAIVMLRVAYRQVHFGEAPPPADAGAADTLILHHDSLVAMVQGTYW
ncbi:MULTISPECIES: phosphotransferase family protein [Streptomyces]|uniref:Phosphotransferase family protein n=1 Tax=Streptomyces venezuelae TaxID=54571 RepID=A0A5P2BCG5_STRVZ|nr:MULTISPECIES: phosphotransferase family protein [Streptomyces]NEA05397.1 phosphotransferase family protein [Streptomyces sp. SID10116]MYY83030.1 phosphotransferase [Streptomyces sp. SID335]MYZ16998.1 phosphotransferase [Streptomyces sp. SID337]NDZ89771.1 phosphotransferase family protein [Streptomyces sp. SID10115]NEB47474.1 phosphotransferase family protein [Streptomyces sp. SID339]